MDDSFLFSLAISSGFFFSFIIFLKLFTSTAPYGRHHSSAHGSILLPNRLAWSFMESPALFLTLLLLSFGRHRSQLVPCILSLFFLTHYFHRAFIYPLRIRPTKARNVPLSIALAAFLFNVYNAYIQARSLSHFRSYPSSWLSSPQFLVGACIFVVGMIINIWADSLLLSLRKDSTDRLYKVPNGGLFDYVACPNYFGEVLEWLGWAILTWSAAGFAFFFITVGNLVPRAVSHYRWYLKNFPDYPRSRRILIPFVY